MSRGTPRRSEQNQSLDEEIGKIPASYVVLIVKYFMDPSPTAISDFDYLLHKLAGLKGPLTCEEMERYLNMLFECHNELEYFERFSESVYQRNPVFTSEHVELLLLCWVPGQRTPLHDHTGSICGVKVLKGCATEIRFKYSRCGTLIPAESIEVPMGGITVSRDSDIHMIANLTDGNQNLVTLHCYSPPLEKMKMYDQSRTVFSNYQGLYDSVVLKAIG
jgi:cysteine dioxygenase